MNSIILSAEDLLAGAEMTFDIAIPAELMGVSTPSNRADAGTTEHIIKIRPLSIGTFSLITRAAKNDMDLIPLFMIKEAVVEPLLTLEQVKKMPIGLVEFIIEHVREVSGLTKKKSL
jgi:hypothetical protein